VGQIPKRSYRAVVKSMKKTVNYFENVKTLDELRKQYRNLAFIHHPDKGGKTAVMQEINNQYERLSKQLIDSNEYFTEERKEWEYKVSEELKQKIEKVIFLPDINIELIGTWIWLTGSTYNVKTILKDEGFMFSATKLAWYWHSGEFTKTSGNINSMEELRDYWGSQNIQSKATEKQLN
jgi:ankyrin repeat protein